MNGKIHLFGLANMCNLAVGTYSMQSYLKQYEI